GRTPVVGRIESKRTERPQRRIGAKGPRSVHSLMCGLSRSRPSSVEEACVKPAPFEYHAPTSVADAVALLAEHTDEAKPLAGGQSLVPMLALRLTRFEHLIDLNRIGEPRGVTREDGTLTVKAMTSQREVEHSPEVAVAVPLLARATPYIGHFQIRNRGTVGGNLAHADPASELPAVALALDAEFEVAS